MNRIRTLFVAVAVAFGAAALTPSAFACDKHQEKSAKATKSTKKDKGVNQEKTPTVAKS